MVNKALYENGYRYALKGKPFTGSATREIYVTQIKYGIGQTMLETFGHFDVEVEEIFPTEEAEAFAIMKTFAEYEPTEEDLAYMLAEDEAVRKNYKVTA